MKARNRCCVLLVVLGLSGPVATRPALAQAVGVESSPRATFQDNSRSDRISASDRELTAAELAALRRRADDFFEGLRNVPSFARPIDRATLLSSYGRVQEGLLRQAFIVYWSRPSDVRRRADGALLPVLGGAHDLVYFETNTPPSTDTLAEADTRDFARSLVNGGGTVGQFAAPVLQGKVGGGHVYANWIVLTRDGRTPFQPAAVGPLLDGEIAQARKRVEQQEQIVAARLKELDASMQPQAVVERREKRRRAWERETRDPGAMEVRLDAAHRTDQWDAERQRAEAVPPPVPAPQHPHWGPRLALQDLQTRLAALEASGPAGRNAPACAWREPGFGSHLAVRFDAIGSGRTPPGCIAMQEVRRDLVDPTRPTSEVQLLTLWWRGDGCGSRWEQATPEPGPHRSANSGRCGYSLPLLKQMDWAQVRRALGWPP